MSAETLPLAAGVQARLARVKWSNMLIHAALIAGALVMIVPFLWMLTLSLKPAALTHQAPYLIPTRFELANYEAAWQAAPFARYYFNSIVMTAGIVLGQVLLSSLAAYAFARLRWRGRDAVFYLFLSALMVPPIFVVIPNFVLLSELGLLDTFAGLAAPYFFMTPFMVFFLRQFFLGISTELEDAARIDGAGHPRIFLRICVPMMAAPLTTAAILAYVIAWNEFMWPLVAGNDPSVRVLTVGLSVFRSGQPQAAPDWTGLMAATVLGALPVILLFLLMGRRIVDSIRFTGLK